MLPIKAVKINDSLYVNLQSIDVPKEVEVSVKDEPLNQFLIFDRSGSMSSYLDEVVNSAVAYCETLPEGSSVSVGYFSGTNDYNLSVPYVLKKELSGVVTTLNTYRKAISLTNFIQILEKVNETASKLNSKSSLFFFTDGCHNSGGGKPQLEAALKRWSEFAAITMFVGYGYIDRDIMSWMAKTTDGAFVHLNEFTNFNALLKDFGIAVEDASPVLPVSIASTEKNIVPISISGKTIIEYTTDNEGVIKYKPSKKGYKGVFYATSTLSPGAEIVEMDITLERGIRSLATILSQKNDVDKALLLLSYLGDKYLISALYNSIAPDEFSEAEDKIRSSVFSTKARFQEGQVANFLPATDAFCVLDALFILDQDENVQIYTNDPDFVYERIGKKTEQQDGPKAAPLDDTKGLKLNGISFHKTRLNVSISTETEAIVPLDPAQFKLTSFTQEEVKQHNLGSTFSTTKFRNYSVIADGRLQTKKLVLSDLSKDTIQALSKVLSKRSDSKYVLDLSALPLINKNYVKMTSATELATNVWEEKKLSDKLSIYNAIKKKLEKELGTKVLKHSDDLTPEAALFLAEKCYIKNGSYNPPVKTVVGDDEYEAYQFDVKIEGFSKASGSDVIKKIDAGSKTTVRESLLAQSYKDFLDSSIAKEAPSAQLKSVVAKIADLTAMLHKVRKFVQLAKFAIILANKGKMDEFPSREHMVLTLSLDDFLQKLDIVFTFSIIKVTVQI